MRILQATWAGTAVFAVAAIAAAVARSTFSAVAVVVSCTLFGAGCVAFLVAYAVAVSRSRTDAVHLAGVFFLAGGVAPGSVRRHLVGALLAQVAVAFATAFAHPFTSQAFVILAPMFGLGTMGLWGARHGQFDPRAVPREHG